MSTAAPRPAAGFARDGIAVLLDLIVPVVGYYVLRAVGLGPVLALVLAALPTGLFLLYNAVRSKRVDALAVFVLILLIVGVAVSFLTGDPRFLLAKAGWVTGVIGLVFLGSLLLARPLAFTFARAMLRRSRLAQRLHTDDWDTFWEREPLMRKAWRVSTVIWGVGTLVDAVLRVIMAYALPVDVVPGLGTGLVIATFLLIQVVQEFYFRRCGLWTLLSRGTPVTSDPR